MRLWKKRHSKKKKKNQVEGTRAESIGKRVNGLQSLENDSHSQPGKTPSGRKQSCQK